MAPSHGKLITAPGTVAAMYEQMGGKVAKKLGDGAADVFAGACGLAGAWAWRVAAQRPKERRATAKVGRSMA